MGEQEGDGGEQPLEFTVAAAARFLGIDESEVRILSRRSVIPKINRKGMLPWITTTQRYIAHLRVPRVTELEGGNLINKSESWIKRLVATGYIEKEPTGQVLVRNVYMGYIRFLTDDARRSQKNTAENRIREARARDIEMKMALRAGVLCEVEEAIVAMQELCGMTRAEFGGLPAAFTRDLVERRRLDKEVNARFNRITKCLEALIADLRQAEKAAALSGATPAASTGNGAAPEL